MKMVRDRTGRFEERPHYDPRELDAECERLITDFLLDVHKRVTWPVTTDDLTKLVERYAGDLDPYADLAAEGPDVEGVTTFPAGKRPQVRISKKISEAPNRENRYRTTLTHELGHIHFHSFLFEVRDARLGLFPAQQNSGHPNQQCLRDSILDSREIDWMEWQAGYACGAILMPASYLRAQAREILKQQHQDQQLTPESHAGARLIDGISRAFAVSKDAARVRLLKTRHLVPSTQNTNLFS